MESYAQEVVRVCKIAQKPLLPFPSPLNMMMRVTNVANESIRLQPARRTHLLAGGEGDRRRHVRKMREIKELIGLKGAQEAG
jgi:hypothetical protein